jgi:hypothetical protein
MNQIHVIAIRQNDSISHSFVEDLLVGGICFFHLRPLRSGNAPITHVRVHGRLFFHFRPLRARQGGHRKQAKPCTDLPQFSVHPFHPPQPSLKPRLLLGIDISLFRGNKGEKLHAHDCITPSRDIRHSNQFLYVWQYCGRLQVLVPKLRLVHYNHCGQFWPGEPWGCALYVAISETDTDCAFEDAGT